MGFVVWLVWEVRFCLDTTNFLMMKKDFLLELGSILNEMVWEMCVLLGDT